MRRTKDVTINLTGRDTGKVFRITEWPSDRGERWGARAILAVSRGMGGIPMDLAESGMAGVAVLAQKSPALFSSPNSEEMIELLDELMECVQFVPDPKRLDLVRPVMGDDIEEIATRLLLKSEVFELHTGFSVAAVLVRLLLQTSAAANTPSTETSQESSGS